MVPRVGLGYDSHVFDSARPLVLGGVPIPGSPGLRGHSDGDALVHAIMDALLGASALGDIGKLFPDTDARWRDADSMALLDDVMERLREAGYAVANIDATVITEEPKLGPHIDAIRTMLARHLGVDRGSVSVKAKTNEGMDAVGRGMGLQVMAIAAVVRN